MEGELDQVKFHLTISSAFLKSLFVNGLSWSHFRFDEIKVVTVEKRQIVKERHYTCSKLESRCLSLPCSSIIQPIHLRCMLKE